MYNDYYLQRIDSKLDDIIDNQQIINTSIVSGDRYLNEYRDEFKQFQYNYFVSIVLLLIFICTFLFYDFYHHLFTDKR